MIFDSVISVAEIWLVKFPLITFIAWKAER
jgi:hypothetical protein